MTIQTSGAISILNLRNEFGGAAPDSLSEYYAGGGLVPAGTSGINGPIPTSGAISLNLFYGASNIAQIGYLVATLNSNSFIEEVKYTTETTSVSSAAASESRDGYTCANHTTFAIIAGGADPASFQQPNLVAYTSMRQFALSNKQISSIGAVLVSGRRSLDGVSSSTTGYFYGGYTIVNNSTVGFAEIDGIIFSNLAATNPAAAMVSARYDVGGMTSSTRGYFYGGYSASTFAPVTEIDGILFSNGTAINPAAAAHRPVGITQGGQSTTAGYTAMGRGFEDGQPLERQNASIGKFLYSTETASQLAARLFVDRINGAGFSTTSRVYFCAGSYTDPNDTKNFIANDTIESVIFSNDTLTGYAAFLDQGGSKENGVHSKLYGL